MYIKEAHMLVEQGLQNIGVFAYSDILPDELDLHLHNEVWSILESEFPSLEGEQKRVLVKQSSLDKYKHLIIKELEIPVTLTNDLYVGQLPSNYYHLIKNRSIVLYECATCNIKSGELRQGDWYIVKGRPINYNGLVYQKGEIFKATDILVYSSGITSEPIKLYELKRRSSRNRVTEEEYVDSVNDNALSKTAVKSPLSTVTDKQLAVYVKKFFIEKVFISYLRKPNIPYLSFRQYVTGDTLSVGLTYEVINGNVIYNGVTYYAKPQFQFDKFTVVAGTTSFTGTGKVRLAGEGDIDLPRQIAIKAIDNVVLRLAAISEQNQQKVVNLSQLSK